MFFCICKKILYYFFNLFHSFNTHFRVLLTEGGTEKERERRRERGERESERHRKREGEEERGVREAGSESERDKSKFYHFLCLRYLIAYFYVDSVVRLAREIDEGSSLSWRV